MKRPHGLLVLGLALSLLCAAAAGVEPPGTELAPPSSGGLDALDPLLRKLATNRRLLIIAAHPDDEDTALLTLVSRGMGGEAAYLSLTRGDGGQNLIGDELGPGLGLLRTEELAAARRLDGARQYFTRAYDFGFSKSLDETLRLWPKKDLLEDAVRIIRRFRPQVVVAIFSGTPRDGHGQHQASAIVAREAFRLAADPAALPNLAAEGLRPWQAGSLWQTTRFLDREKTTLILPTGGLEPLTGFSFQQIAVASRSLHRSQGTGALQPIGPNEARAGWIEGAGGRDAKDLFAGTDGELASLAAGADPARRRDAETRLARAAALATDTRRRLSAAEMSSLVTPIASILADLRAVRDEVAGDTPAAENAAATLAEKIAAAESALGIAAGISIDALADTQTAAPGDGISVTVQLANAGREAVEVEGAELTSPEGWTVATRAAGKPVPPGTLAEWKLGVTIPAGAAPTVPYFLRRPLAGAMYDWSDVPSSVRGEPFAPPPLFAALTLRIADARVTLRREATFRYRDEAFGEIRRPVRAVPKAELAVDPPLIVRPIGARGEAARIAVTVQSNASGPIAGRVEAAAPAGWTAEPRPFSLAKKGDRASVELALRPPAGGGKPGRFEIAVTALLDSGERLSTGIRILDYGHIRPTPFPREAAVTVTALDLKLPKLTKVGYLRGASDRVPEALAAVGVPIRLLSAADLDHGDLSGYDAIVLGTRAYETEPALPNANRRLLDWVRAGGLLIVQYQQLGFTEGGFAPEKLDIVRPIDRVTDETAPVTLLDPGHPIFHVPNAIGPDDWQGWIQERGLYFAHAWGPSFVPLLSMSDPGEPEQKGSLIVAKIGKGRYIYTGLSFFRELPAGVPGAYRLFANLLAWNGRGR